MSILASEMQCSRATFNLGSSDCKSDNIIIFVCLLMFCYMLHYFFVNNVIKISLTHIEN